LSFGRIKYGARIFDCYAKLKPTFGRCSPDEENQSCCPGIIDIKNSTTIDYYPRLFSQESEVDLFDFKYFDISVVQI
jgi:hypothetical protein